jgi:hypothetical protein
VLESSLSIPYTDALYAELLIVDVSIEAVEVIPFCPSLIPKRLSKAEVASIALVAVALAVVALLILTASTTPPINSRL